MVSDGDHFKTQFYNLEGVHYNERKKNFSKWIRSIDRSILPQLLDIRPRNYLENIFYVDILIYAKQIDRLVEILKEGNGVLTSRILKQKWLFKEAFETMSENTIVNEFLPSLSYSIRMKVLKKMALSFSTKRMDEMFDFLLGRYGLFIAKQFLFSCSSVKIAQQLKNEKIILSSEQLKRILDKDYNLIKIYMEEYKKNTGEHFKDEDFWAHLFWKYPNLYFEFQPLFKCHVQLGRHTTKTVLKINKEGALKDIETKQNHLNFGTVTRELKDFDKEYFYKFFTSRISQIQYQMNWLAIANLLKKYPQKKRWDVLSTAFKRAYNENLIDHLEVLDEEVAIWFPDEIKHQWADVKFDKTENLMYVKYFEPKKAFTFVKERINVTSSINQRSGMMVDLIKTSHTSKDYNNYEAVLQYILFRHRNDSEGLRRAIIEAIKDNIDYELSTESFWSNVNQLIDVFRVNGECVPFENSCQYLIFAAKRKLPLDEPIAQYVKDVANHKWPNWTFYYFDQEPEIKGTVLRQVIKILHTIDFPPSNKRHLIVRAMGDAIAFNNAHKDIAIDLNESKGIVEVLKDVFVKDDNFDQENIICIQYVIANNYGRNSGKTLKVCDENRFLAIVKSLIVDGKIYEWDSLLFDALKKPRTTDFQNSLLEYYFTIDVPKRGSNYSRKPVFEYFIREEPEVFAKYVDQILALAADNRLDYSIIKLYSHLALDEKCITYFNPLVTVGSTFEKKASLIKVLSKIMSTEDFINVAQPYIPEKSKLDSSDTKQKKLYEAQCAIAKALANLDECPKLIPLLEPFCKGDYFQASLALLYKVLYGINEEQATSIINILRQRSVSTRKHAVYLSFEVLPQQNALDIFDAITTKENDVSVKKYLLRALLKYFLKNPSERLLDRVLTCIIFADKNDKEMLIALTESINNVREKFRPVLVEKLWNFLGIIEEQGAKVLQYRRSLLSTVNSYDVNFFSSLNESFCKDVIKNHFFSDEDSILRIDEVYTFVAKYLLIHKDEQHFQFVFNFLKEFKRLHWESNDSKKLRPVYLFFERVYGHFNQDVGVLKLFKTYWEQVFSHEESFNEYVLLNLLVQYKDTFPDIAKFSTCVSRRFQELTLEYGSNINDLLLQSTNTFFASIGGLPNDKVYNKANFAWHLLNHEGNELNCFIASNLIVNNYKDQEMRSNVINALKTVDNVVVRIRCNNLLKR